MAQINDSLREATSPENGIPSVWASGEAVVAERFLYDKSACQRVGLLHFTVTY